MLAGGRRGRDADHLAGTALQNEDVTDADVVARDRDSVARGIILRGAATARAARADSLAVLRNLDRVAAFRMQNAVSKLVHSVTEGMVVAY